MKLGDAAFVSMDSEKQKIRTDAWATSIQPGLAGSSVGQWQQLCHWMDNRQCHLESMSFRQVVAVKESQEGGHHMPQVSSMGMEMVNWTGMVGVDGRGV